MMWDKVRSIEDDTKRKVKLPREQLHPVSNIPTV